MANLPTLPEPINLSKSASVDSEALHLEKPPANENAAIVARMNILSPPVTPEEEKRVRRKIDPRNQLHHRSNRRPPPRRPPAHSQQSPVRSNISRPDRHPLRRHVIRRQHHRELLRGYQKGHRHWPLPSVWKHDGDSNRVSLPAER